MAANISGLHQFADDVGPLPLKLLDDSYSTLSIALNTLATFSNFYTDTGTTNAYTINTTQYQFASYTDGLQVTVRIANTNTGASTLNVNGLGAMPILTSIGSELQPNALVAGSMVTFIYNAQRTAWQIASGGGGGQITAPLNVTNPSGQAALSINTDGSGYLGDFNGNGLSWDAACHFTFEGGATLDGTNAPFSILDPSNQQPFFTVQVPVAPGGTPGSNCVVDIGPAGTSHTLQSILCLNGATNGTVLRVASAQNTIVGPTLTDATPWLAEFHGAGYFPGEAPPGYQPPTPGASFGVVISAGTNANDVAFLVEDDAEGGTGTATYRQFFLIRGDGTGGLGPSPNQLVWDTAGNFTLTGTATLPPAASINSIGDVTITNPQNGQSLIYNSATQQWVNSTPVTALVGLSDVHITGPAPGQVLTYSVSPTPGWVNANIPGWGFLSSLSIGGNPQAGEVLTWDGSGWIAAQPGQVAQFPLTSLTDVSIVGPINRQVLTWDAPNSKWINAPAATPNLATLPDVSLTGQTQGQVLAWDGTLNRWVNSALPGGSVIALDTLMDTNISDPQNNQVLTWDYASARWVNRPAVSALASLTDVTLTSASLGQLLTYNGTHWVNGGSAVIAASAGTALTVSGVAGQQAVAINVPAGANGLSVGGAGTSASNWQFNVGNGNDALLRITADGSGFIGGNSTNTLQWNAAGNFTVNAPSSGIALTVNSNSDSQLSLNTPVGQQYVTQAWKVAGAVKAQAYWDDTGGAFNVGASIGGGTNLLSADTVRMAINAAGNVTVNAPSNGSALILNGSAGTVPLDIRGGASGTAAGYAMRVNTGPRGDCFFIRGDGSVNILPGVSGPVVSINQLPVAQGNAIVDIGALDNVTNGGNTLRVWGGVNANALYVQGATNTANGYFGLVVVSPAVSSASNGIKVQAGTTGGDTAISAQNAAAQVVFEARGDRSFCLPGITANVAPGTYQAVQWWAGGFGSIVASSSSIRYKRNVRSLTRSRAREILSKLRAVTFRQIAEDAPDLPCYGFIAEEVAEVDRSLCPVDAEGKPAGVSDERIVALLVPLIQELLGLDEPEAA